MKAPVCHCRLQPIRTLEAVSPGGVHVYLSKFSEGDKEISFGRGNLSYVDDATFWRAKLAAEKPGQANWDKAVGILTAGGFRVLA